MAAKGSLVADSKISGSSPYNSDSTTDANINQIELRALDNLCVVRISPGSSRKIHRVPNQQSLVSMPISNRVLTCAEEGTFSGATAGEGATLPSGSRPWTPPDTAPLGRGDRSGHPCRREYISEFAKDLPL